MQIILSIMVNGFYGLMLFSTAALCLMNEALAEELFSKAPWYQGSVEEGFAQAKKQNKDVFIYWGAVWCPPCNEIKTEIFSHEGFAGLMRDKIAIYLDGDSSEAQDYGETFKASGYPTLLLLTHDRKELFRIDHATNFQEFSQALVGASSSKLPIEQRINQALSGNPSKEDWMSLAFFSWGDTGALPQEDFSKVKTLDALVKACKPLDDLACTKLRMQLLAEVAREPKVELATEAFKKDMHKFLLSQWRELGAIRAHRSQLLYESDSIVAFIDAKATLQSRLVRQWLEAAQRLANDKQQSVDVRLWANYPFLKLEKLSAASAKGYKPSKAIKQRIEQAVDKALLELQSKYERHAVVSGAAYLLRLVEDHERAEKILLAELESTDTPWYYQSSLASLEADRNNEAAALNWAKKAKDSAVGHATKIQWTVAYLSRLAKAKVFAKGEFEAVVRDYYALATRDNDGFLGRNKYRANSVAKVLKELNGGAFAKAVARKNESSCEKLSGENRSSCREHFQSLRL